MNEVIVNLFFFVEKRLVKSLGASGHTFEGDEEQAKLFLQNRVAIGSTACTSYSLPVENLKAWLGIDAEQGLPIEMYSYLRRCGKAVWLFEEALRDVRAPAVPFVLITAVVDGQPQTDAVGHANPIDCPEIHFKAFGEKIKGTDWLAANITASDLNVHELLGDDFTEAIKVLYASKLYVSAMKLIMSFIDTVAFIELGDVQGNYVTWLSKYANLALVGAKPSELWEFRNAILHMTNPFSRKVHSGSVAPLSFYIEASSRNVRVDPDTGTKMFCFEAFYEAIIEALDRWTKSYSGNLSKQLEFIERYDTILSEGRIARFLKTPT